MKYKNLVISIFLVLAIGYIFNKFKLNIEKDDKANELNLIKKYLLNDDNNLDINNKLNLIKKPILWVHIDYEKNSRNWLSFYSRSSFDYNQDYIYLTIKSIIDKCNQDFHIIIIDDKSFKMLLPNWKVDFCKISNPIKTNMRILGIAKLLYNYGGIYLENSFILFKTLKPIYDKMLHNKKIITAEFKNTSHESNTVLYMPSWKFLGCLKNCNIMYKFIQNLEILFSNDFTSNHLLENTINKFLLSYINIDAVNYIDGRFIGIKDIDNNPITIDQLVSSNFLDLDLDSYALYIPRDELLKRNCYNWFVYLKPEEVLQQNTNISKYLLLMQ